MSTVAKRSISLSPELAAAVDNAVASGEYGNASEVVRDALRQWQERRALFGHTLEQLRQMWDEGTASGEARPFDRAAILRMKEAGRRELAKRRKRAE